MQNRSLGDKLSSFPVTHLHSKIKALRILVQLYNIFKIQPQCQITIILPFEVFCRRMRKNFNNDMPEDDWKGLIFILY